MQSHFPTATMITIAPLSPKNFEAVVALKVSEEQSSFVAPNVLSIAQSKTWNHLVSGVIEKDATPIGFVLYGKDPESRRVYIVRLMIDRAYQRKGHGTTALGLLLVKLRETYACTEINVSVVPGNLGSERLFYSLGSMPTGEVDDDGEVVFSRQI